MPLYRNTNEEFGSTEIVLADSKEKVLELWKDDFKLWAIGHFNSLWESDQVEIENPDEWVANDIKRMKEQFLAGLVEVEPIDEDLVENLVASVDYLMGLGITLKPSAQYLNTQFRDTYLKQLVDGAERARETANNISELVDQILEGN